MRRHIIAGAEHHRGELSALIDRYPFTLHRAEWAGEETRNGRILLSEFLLREPPQRAAVVYLTLVAAFEGGTLSDLLSRFGLHNEWDWDLTPIAAKVKREESMEIISIICCSMLLLYIFLFRGVGPLPDSPAGPDFARQECELAELRSAREAGTIPNLAKCEAKK